MNTEEDFLPHVNEVYQTFFDPLIQSFGFITCTEFIETFLNSGLVEDYEVEKAFDGLVAPDEIMDELRIREVILQSMMRDDGNNN